MGHIQQECQAMDTENLQKEVLHKTQQRENKVDMSVQHEGDFSEWFREKLLVCTVKTNMVICVGSQDKYQVFNAAFVQHCTSALPDFNLKLFELDAQSMKQHHPFSKSLLEI
jgi:hypothetical protein